jgi:hypothetical protein
MHIRILGYLIREGPSLTASEFVTKEVNSYEDENEIDKAGERYYLCYLRACTLPSHASFRSLLFNSFVIFKTFKGHTPSQSSQSTYAEYETKKLTLI